MVKNKNDKDSYVCCVDIYWNCISYTPDTGTINIPLSLSYPLPIFVRTVSNMIGDSGPTGKGLAMSWLGEVAWKATVVLSFAEEIKKSWQFKYSYTDIG